MPMRLSVSNIAWDRSEDAAVAALLGRHGIDAIDVAPGKYLDLSVAPDRGAAEEVRAWWGDRGIEIVGMQALLFGTSGLNLFGPVEVRHRMLAHLGRVCRVGEWLGARRLTFGSPSNRDRTGLEDPEANRIAIPFFRQLGAMASDSGVVICLEPNPPRYRCNFMTTTGSAADVVRQVDHPGIRLQLDTGAMTICAEQAGEVIRTFAKWVEHVHASEPDLLPVGMGGTDHVAVAKVLEAVLPASIVTIEMLRPKEVVSPEWLEKPLGSAIAAYRSCKGGDCS